MKKKLIYLLFTLIIIMFVSGCSIDDLNTIIQADESKQDDQPKEKVVVDRVVDGDTVKVEMPDGSIESVRLLLVDTPESVHPIRWTPSSRHIFYKNKVKEIHALCP